MQSLSKRDDVTRYLTLIRLPRQYARCDGSKIGKVLRAEAGSPFRR